MKTLLNFFLVGSWRVTSNYWPFSCTFALAVILHQVARHVATLQACVGSTINFLVLDLSITYTKSIIRNVSLIRNKVCTMPKKLRIEVYSPQPFGPLIKASGTAISKCAPYPSPQRFFGTVHHCSFPCCGHRFVIITITFSPLLPPTPWPAHFSGLPVFVNWKHRPHPVPQYVCDPKSCALPAAVIRVPYPGACQDPWQPQAPGPLAKPLYD